MTGPFPTHCLHVCSPQNHGHFFQGSHSNSAFALKKSVNNSSHHSCGPGAPFEPSLSPVTLTPALQGCQPPAVSQPCSAEPNAQDDTLAWPQHSPVPRELPVPRAGAASSHSLAGKLRLCSASSMGSPHCFCIPGSCWVSLSHRCPHSVAGSPPASFNIIQYFMGLGP